MYAHMTVQQPLATMLHLSATYWQQVFELQAVALKALSGTGRTAVETGFEVAEDAAHEVGAARDTVETVVIDAVDNVPSAPDSRPL
jgi:hypothetical protein